MSNFQEKFLESLKMGKHVRETEYSENEKIIGNIPLMQWKEFACGWSAAFINITVTYPINKLIFRQVRRFSK